MTLLSPALSSGKRSVATLVLCPADLHVQGDVLGVAGAGVGERKAVDFLFAEEDFLRAGEAHFELWLTHLDHRLRADGREVALHGQVEAAALARRQLERHPLAAFAFEAGQLPLERLVVIGFLVAVRGERVRGVAAGGLGLGEVCPGRNHHGDHDIVSGHLARVLHRHDIGRRFADRHGFGTGYVHRQQRAAARNQQIGTFGLTNHGSSGHGSRRRRCRRRGRSSRGRGRGRRQSFVFEACRTRLRRAARCLLGLRGGGPCGMETAKKQRPWPRWPPALPASRRRQARWPPGDCGPAWADRFAQPWGRPPGGGRIPKESQSRWRRPDRAWRPAAAAGYCGPRRRGPLPG